MDHPLGGAFVVRHDSDGESLHTMRGAGGSMPRRQNCGSVDVCDVARNPRGGVFELRNSATIVEDNQVCAPLDAADATGTTSRRHPVSSGMRQRRQRSAARRAVSDTSSMTSEETQDSEMLYTLVHGVTGNVEKRHQSTGDAFSGMLC